jgi:O-succinylbenzoate synthase
VFICGNLSLRACASDEERMSFQVETIELREIRLPLKEPFRISSGVCAERRICLLELRHPDGGSAWAECVAGEQPNYSPETIDTAWLAITEWLAPRVLGRRFAGPPEVHAVLARGVCGHHMAKAAVEMGCWALAAERRGVPLAELLGGTRERIATGISLGIQASPEALVERARAAVAAGYRKVKLKIEPGADVAYVRAVRGALGPAAHLMADANSAYTLDDADHLAELDAFDLMMIEQPLAQDDLVRHAALQRRLRTPICLDEAITDVARAEDMIALGSGRIVNIKPGRVGGYLEAARVHTVCQAMGAPVWCGGMLETGIGRAANLALASLPGFTLPGDTSASARYYQEDLTEPFVMVDGRLPVPQGPGVGVLPRPEMLAAFTTAHEELRAG